MSIQSQINRLKSNVSAALSALVAKGVAVPAGANSDDLAGLIAQVGGVDLHVVGGTTKPTSPKDNTIWVNTSVNIGAVTLAPNAPASPAAGDVWVNTTNKYNSSGQNASTNILRISDNPYLEINVLNISQWDGSAWATRDGSAIYANGGWTHMALYILYNGALNESFPIVSLQASSTSAVFSSANNHVYDGTNIKVGKISTSKIYGITVNTKIDFSKYNKITATVTGNTGIGGHNISLAASVKKYNETSHAGCSDLGYVNTNSYNANNTTIELNISNVGVEGYVYIVAYVNNNSYSTSNMMTVHKLVLTA